MGQYGVCLVCYEPRAEVPVVHYAGGDDSLKPYMALAAEKGAAEICGDEMCVRLFVDFLDRLFVFFSCCLCVPVFVWLQVWVGG